MRSRLFFLCCLLTVNYYLFAVAPAFAQDATAPADRRDQRLEELRQIRQERQQQLDRRRQELEQRTEERKQMLEGRRAEVEARRSERQKQIIERMKQKLSAVIDRLNNAAGRLTNHVERIRARAAELSANRGVDVSGVESALTEAERHIGLAELEVENVKSQIAELEASDTPRGVAQTFRSGVQSVHLHFKDARANLAVSLKALREAAKESRPTGATEE